MHGECEFNIQIVVNIVFVGDFRLAQILVHSYAKLCSKVYGEIIYDIDKTES